MIRKTNGINSEAASGDYFGRFATDASNWLGSKWAFVLAVTIIAVWSVTGPLFHYSDTWQLVINTSTTIVTFLMVFLIQNTQNRDARAINLKLDELIRAIDKARNQMINIEQLSDVELDVVEEQFKKLRASARVLRQTTPNKPPAEQRTDVAPSVANAGIHEGQSSAPR